MKRLYLLISLFVFFSFVFPCRAQFNSALYDKEAFLIGTLDDYMGYLRTFTAGSASSIYQRVDIYNRTGSKRIALFMDSLFNSEYPDIFLTYDEASGITELYSPTLSRKIDKYFDYKPFAMRTIQGDTIFTGSILKNTFKTDKEKLSFLLGVYLRYGYNSTISLANSLSKAAVCVEMLKEFGCKDVEYTIKKGCVPMSQIITFKPSLKIQKIIDEADKLFLDLLNINTDRIEFAPDGINYIWFEREHSKIPFKVNEPDQPNGKDTVIGPITTAILPQK